MHKANHTCIIQQAYGVYLLDKFPFRNQIPLKEDLPRVPAEYAKDLFYYHEVDLLQELSTGKSWSWCEVRPDVIVRPYTRSTTPLTTY